MQKKSNFIKTIIQKDLQNKKCSQIITRFPPEPNGFLHLGHARAIIINFELAYFFQGKTLLRYDDTNPSKEKQIYVNAILNDIKWLGYTPYKITFASDYFPKMYQMALFLIKQGKAYVDDQTAEQIAQSRGNLNQKGTNSPYRNRSIEENILLFEKMKKGEFAEGSKVLRAKIDMQSPNLNLRDPILYRILSAFTLKQKHWHIFPTYDYAHPLEDSFENITHSLCSLEFEDHRPLYDWIIKETQAKHTPRQIEFGRLNLTQTLMSKRHLNNLVEKKLVKGWDDPRMPTLSGIRKKGYTPEAIKNFILETGLSKVNSQVKQEMLESFVRDDLKGKSLPRMAVINPLKLTITNFPENQIETLKAPWTNNFNTCNCGNATQTQGKKQEREIYFSRHLYIEKDDFALQKLDKNYKRLTLGEEVRLFHAYFVKAYDVVKNKKGEITEILATYDPQTKSGSGFKDRKPNGTIHFTEVKTACKATFNFFTPLLCKNGNFNEKSWHIKKGFVESSLKKCCCFQNHFQFLRQGYFAADKIIKDTNGQTQELNFNEVVSLKSNPQK
ncbi:Glutaminyl-tRNA synthetase [Candidatus Phytoplasma asteris]|uniref:Glutamine--tRNA ligase n=1 Tax=Candidatus Phytoplasma asteris TaxID=85620 RepID=A0ABZ2YEM0_9MOLU